MAGAAMWVRGRRPACLSRLEHRLRWQGMIWVMADESHSPQLSRRRFLGAGAGLAALMGSGAAGLVYYNREVDRLLTFPAPAVRSLYQGRTTPLLERFPDLQGQLAWTPLGEGGPTPVEPFPLPAVPRAGQTAAVYVKRDDLTSPRYGGNKVRKLEHVLAEARLGQYTALVTVGGLGSNQCLASAIHGGRMGFAVDACLFNQPVTEQVRSNLLAGSAAGANLIYGGDYFRTAVRCVETYLARRRAGDRPYYIPAGATTSLANAGYVNAGLELGQQVRRGELPEPDRLLVPAGSCGTTAGLIVGLKLAGLRTRCVAVRINLSAVTNKVNIRRLARRTLGALRGLTASIPDVAIDFSDFDVESRFYGGGYGEATAESLVAESLAASRFPLEQTYSAKAFAACLAHARELGAGKTVLFWNTFNSAALALGDPAALPADLRQRLEG